MRIRERRSVHSERLLLASLMVVVAFLVGPAGCELPEPGPSYPGELLIVTWNVRGYPENDPCERTWFHAELQRLHPDVLCIQEIANQERVDEFLQTETAFTQVAFVNSTDGQDNAIFATQSVALEDMSDPQGFQHPAQCARVSSGGFDAVVVTVHLSWSDTAQREQEKRLLEDVVSQALAIDPDVIVVGDFNTEGPEIETLAQAIGFDVMNPVGQEGIGTTYAEHRYDHFLISPDLAAEEAISCQIKTYSGSDLDTAKRVSDHRPVVARFSIGSQFRDRP
jgi:endonuclease/exonuclease/phosphatase family metal-dependent hydrolase